MERAALSWPADGELRIGLGCMRLSNPETVAAAAAAGITVFDTARAYGANEELLAHALRACGAQDTARIVTKGGMGESWIPDGRAKAIIEDCETSLAALDGLPIDLYLLHAPDPRTPWSTSVRALARLRDEGLVRRVGVSNVSRRQLDQALELAPLAAVEVALSPYDDTAIRGGLLQRCSELEIALIAHSPLGGPRRASRLHRREALERVAGRRGVTPAEVALAWLLALSPAVVPIPGARTPEAAISAASAAGVTLSAEDRAELDRPRRRPAPSRRRSGGDVVLVMGIQGAGKTRLAKEYVERGYVRLNRDERGGKLRGLADVLDETLDGGTTRVVLDNTYLTRAARSHVIEVAHRHRLPARCLWIDIPLARAQVNLVGRMLERLGALPEPEELRQLARREPGLLAPTQQMRSLRELEPPALDEGFSAVERVPFVPVPVAADARAAVFVAASALRTPSWQRVVATASPAAPHLVFDWIPGGPDTLEPLAAALGAQVAASVWSAHCSHQAGPPVCWCRPPLPGLPLAFAHRHHADPARSILIGTTPTHRTLAGALGCVYLDAMNPDSGTGH